MRQLSLQEIKRIELDLLKKFDCFCKENKINYFLSNGTLLGAIKYKGFIPWDDDIDVLVPREDYNKLISLFQDNEQYKLFAFEREEKYYFPFAKLCDLTTLKKEQNTDNGVNLGVDIDIFPLDSWDCNFKKAQKEARHINKMMFYLELAKSHTPNSSNKIKRILKFILMIFCKIVGSKRFVCAIIQKSDTKKQDNSYLGCKTWCIYGEREIIPANVFSHSVMVEFEGQMFPAPIGYDTYLRSLYGEYEMDPPPEKQRTHHSFKAYKL